MTEVETGPYWGGAVERGGPLGLHPRALARQGGAVDGAGQVGHALDADPVVGRVAARVAGGDGAAGGHSISLVMGDEPMPSAR